MKRIAIASLAITLSGATAWAADITPVYTPAYQPSQLAAPILAYNWTGFYIGGHIGGGWATERSTELAPGTIAFPTGTAFAPHSLSGFLGGMQGGFNWQDGNFVFGVEGEWSWEDLKGTSTTVSTVNGFVSTTTVKNTDLAMLTGRLGYAANSWLFFIKGGGAWGQSRANGTGVTGAGVFFDTTNSSANRTGWVVGGGVEWGFAPNWSAKIEYNYVDLGSTTVVINSSAAAPTSVISKDRVDIVKAGVNYHFNWGGRVY